MKIDVIIKKMRPVRLIALGFIFTILVGAILLSLPISNVGEPISFLDHLFMATTSVCVTGLVTVPIAGQYSVFGELVILVLIQIGGLSLISILSFILVLIKRSKISLKEKRLIQEAVNQSSIAGMSVYLKRVVCYTAVFEVIGAILLSIVFVPEFGLKGIYYGVFHAVSAFCNAGLDILGTVSLLDYATNPIVNFTVMFLIIAGGIGYAVWFELQEQLKNIHRKVRLSLHTKMVLKLTGVLLIVGTVLFLVLEYQNPNTIGDMSFMDKIMVSMFQSVTLRTAGFSTVNFAFLHPATKFFMLFFMLIGGAPGGTAGGIKVTTFLILFMYAIQSHVNDDGIVLAHRTIGRDVIRKAYFLLSLYITLIIIALFIFLVVEPFDALDSLFEIVSAIGTVGLSVGITSQLSSVSKMVIIVLMYVGRTGPLSIYLSLLRKEKPTHQQIHYPKADIMIG